MKKFPCLLAATSLLLTPVAFAAKGDKSEKKKAAEANAVLLKKFDTNANGKIDPEEMDAIRKEFATTTDDSLKALDTDKDGKLSDEEIAALNAKPKKAKKKA